MIYSPWLPHLLGYTLIGSRVYLRYASQVRREAGNNVVYIIRRNGAAAYYVHTLMGR